MIWILLALQTTLPDIELDARATVRRVEIRESRGVSLTVRAQPDSGSTVDVQAPERRGQRVLRNVEVRVRAEARLAAPNANTASRETRQ